MSKNRTVVNPYTNKYEFAEVPAMESRGVTFEPGFVYLRVGEHRGASRGFGVAHILIDHDDEIRKSGYDDDCNETRIARFVADILVSGSPIYSEFEHAGGKHKATVVRGHLGTVVLERRFNHHNEIIYSVVTAYALKRPKGTLIGRLK